MSCLTFFSFFLVDVCYEKVVCKKSFFVVFKRQQTIASFKGTLNAYSTHAIYGDVAYRVAREPTTHESAGTNSALPFFTTITVSDLCAMRGTPFLMTYN